MPFGRVNRLRRPPASYSNRDNAIALRERDETMSGVVFVGDGGLPVYSHRGAPIVRVVNV